MIPMQRNLNPNRILKADKSKSVDRQKSESTNLNIGDFSNPDFPIIAEPQIYKTEVLPYAHQKVLQKI